ncbi:hypothetical protein DE146DRAFT_766330 [Phaeosphaeria sp. MPI-PUGE-AT-0046c]|nr:hypothetical protein DE146DRAFT_766330 [Phaeosphaeria sp. MPI-PUGE-AT-0046c]
MVSSKLLSLSALTLLPLSLAAPTPVADGLTARNTDIEWIPINFNGKTIYQNNAVVEVASINPTEEVKERLRRQEGLPNSTTNDQCDGAEVNSHPPPFANTADCAAIRDWAGTQNAYYGVWDNTPDTHALWYAGTCVFEAGTRNLYKTWIGSSNVRDIMTLAINKWQSGGVLASQGTTHCKNSGTTNAAGGISKVSWTIKHH